MIKIPSSISPIKYLKNSKPIKYFQKVKVDSFETSDILSKGELKSFLTEDNTAKPGKKVFNKVGKFAYEKFFALMNYSLRQNQKKLLKMTPQKQEKYLAKCKKEFPNFHVATQEEITKTTDLYKKIKEKYGVKVSSDFDSATAKNIFTVLAFLNKKGYELPKKIFCLGDDKEIWANAAGKAIRDIDAVFLAKTDTQDEFFYNFIHETGHTLHHKKLSKEEYSYLKQSKFNDETKNLITSELNEYASTSPFEFVAEYFNISHYKAAEGITFSPQLDSLYKLLKGPAVKE